MPNYKEMYFQLAGQLADTIEALDKLSAALKLKQLELEESFLEDNNIAEI